MFLSLHKHLKLTIMITLVVLFKNSLPKGLMTDEQYEVCQSKRWWDYVDHIQVPIEDWKEGKVTITNIHKYL